MVLRLLFYGHPYGYTRASELCPVHVTGSLPQRLLRLRTFLCCEAGEERKEGRTRLFPKVIPDGFGLRLRHYRRQCGGVGLFHCLHTAEMLQEAARSLSANSRNVKQLG